MLLKKDVYNARIKNIEHKTPDIINLATKINEVKKEIPRITNLAITISLYDKINEDKNKIPNITNLTTTTDHITVENKIRNVSNLVKELTKTQKIVK